jgi:hypothetical protein
MTGFNIRKIDLDVDELIPGGKARDVVACVPAGTCLHLLQGMKRFASLLL